MSYDDCPSAGPTRRRTWPTVCRGTTRPPRLGRHCERAPAS